MAGRDAPRTTRHRGRSAEERVNSDDWTFLIAMSVNVVGMVAFIVLMTLKTAGVI